MDTWKTTSGSARPLYKGASLYKARITRVNPNSGTEFTDILVCTKQRLAELGLVRQGKRYVLPRIA